MSDAADRSLRSWLDDIASATPAPGGGSSAGWACAIAAALVEMAAGFVDSERATQIATRARELRDHAIDIAERELYAYGPALAALKLPKTDPDRASRLDAALSDAAETPLALTRSSAQVASLALEISSAGSPHLRGDALAGLHIAAGACEAAARLVEINLARRPDDERLGEVAALTRNLSSEPRSPR